LAPCVAEPHASSSPHTCQQTRGGASSGVHSGASAGGRSDAPFESDDERLKVLFAMYQEMVEAREAAHA
jgi:hypothetical protein